MKKGVIIESQKRWTVVLTPEGEFCKIPFESTHIVGEEVFFQPTTVKSFNAKRRWNLFTLRNGSMVAACLLILMISFPFFGGTQAYAAVTIDINPSIELDVDEQSIVIDAHSLNPDGKVLLQSIEWKNRALSIVTVAIIDSAENKGMMNEEKQVIITTTFYRDEPENLDNQWKTMLGDIAGQVDQELTVVIVEGKKEWVKEAKEKKIAPGSYMMVKQAEEQGVTIQEKDIKEGKLKLDVPVPGIKVIHTNQGKAPEHSNSKKKEKIIDQKPDKNQNKIEKEKLREEWKEQREQFKEQINGLQNGGKEKFKELRSEEREKLIEQIKEKFTDLRKEEKEKLNDQQKNQKWNEKEWREKESNDRPKDFPIKDKSSDERKDPQNDKMRNYDDDQHGKDHADYRVPGNQKDSSKNNSGNGKNHKEQNKDKKDTDKKDSKNDDRD